MSVTKIYKENKYVDLRVNGRLFPSWVMKNFKKYKLEEIFINTAIDPCNVNIKAEFKKYQLFLSSYLDFKSPYHNILVYHGVGAGKSASAINIYNILYNYNPGWNVFILLKASIRGVWEHELNQWLSNDEYDYRFKNIRFISYDSPIADKQFIETIKTVDASKKSMYIIDEAHNFIRNVYSNVTTGSGKRAQVIYDYIITDRKDNSDTRIILLSATPAINTPFEFALLFNLLRSNTFPTSESEFNRLFVTTTTHSVLNKNAKNMFERRIMGLVSYYVGVTPDLYAKSIYHTVDIQMSDYQDDIYGFFEEIEAKMAQRAKLQGRGGSTTYRSYTRQGANFVFPAISQNVTGETRPRPGKFRISEREATKLQENKLKKKNVNNDTVVHLAEYVKAMREFIDEFDQYLGRKDDDDIRKGHTIMNDVNIFLNKYNGDFEKFHKDESVKSSLYDGLYTSSAKMLNIAFNIMNSPGPVVVYSNYVLMEGLEIFKIYLSYFGFYNYMAKMQYQENKIGIIEFHGGIDIKSRFIAMKEFNKLENKYGLKLKIMLISPAGSEGLTLHNIRQFHVMEPYWNEVRIAQVIGRAVRLCSHKQLPMEERRVDIYRYKSVRKNRAKLSTDQYIENLAKTKDNLIQSFLEAIKEASVDCQLFKNHNMLNQEYKCFQFDEPSLFEQHIGPAYKDDIADDIKIDNGSNSIRSMTLKVKVFKIKAVLQLTAPEAEEKPTYSNPELYWYYPKSNVVYDYELHFPIGKVAIDETNLPLKLNKDTYIIDKVIPIPLIDQ